MTRKCHGNMYVSYECASDYTVPQKSVVHNHENDNHCINCYVHIVGMYWNESVEKQAMS